jgi:hypothetical protein
VAEVKDPRAAGWKRDPSGRFAGRYWDGAGWTEHVVGHDRVTSTDPIPGQAPPAARPPVTTPPVKAPPATQTLPATPATRATTTLPAAPAAAGERAWPTWTKLALPLAAVLVVLGVVISFDRRDSPTTTRPRAGRSQTARTYNVGETARSGDFDVTVYGLKDPQPPGQFLRPDVGKRLVSVDVQITNKGASQQGFSGLLGFHLIDAGNNEYDMSFGEVDPPAPDGDIAPGQSLRGFVVFEVPDGAAGFRFKARGSLTTPEVQFALG